MKILVSLCNRHAARYRDEGLREIYLLRIDTSTQSIDPIQLPREVTQGTLGMTGISRRECGYVCMLTSSSLLYLGEDLEVQRSYQLTTVYDGHSLAYFDGRCYIVSSATDSIIEFSPEDGEKVFWRANSVGTDSIHLNAILRDDDGWWVTAFGPKTGPLWSSAEQGYLLNVSTGERRMTALYHPHSVVSSDGTLYLCESSRMRVRSTHGLDVYIPRGYLRGLAVELGCMLVGCTRGRKNSKSTGAVIDNSADPGELCGEPGLAIYRTGKSPKDVEFDSFIGIGEFGDEVYDIVVIPDT